MTSPLSGSVARTIGNAMRGTFLDAVLTRDVPGVGGTAYDPAPATPTSYPCKAIVERYSMQFRKDGLVEQNDRKVLVLANGLGVRPQAGDRVAIGGVSFTAITVSTDPAGAVWEIQGRM